MMKKTLPARYLLTFSAVAVALVCQAKAQTKDTPNSMIDAIHSAFGEHHARAVHTKGVMMEGTFTPSPEARSIVMTPIFTGSPRPVIARFSLFAGLPNLPDNDDGAAPSGFGVKIKAEDGDDFDIELNQHKDFIVSTFDEFATFMRAVGATKPDSPHPNPVEQFLSAHPHAQEFLATRSYPESYAKARFFGVNSVKFTNATGASAFVRYTAIPAAGEAYLSPEQRKTRNASYLNDEVLERLAKGPIVFDWYAQVAAEGDKIDDPAIAWPDSRKQVKLGTFTLNKAINSVEADKALLLLPGQPHAGVEAADPMLTLRNQVYPISQAQRQ